MGTDNFLRLGLGLAGRPFCIFGDDPTGFEDSCTGFYCSSPSGSVLRDFLPGCRVELEFFRVWICLPALSEARTSPGLAALPNRQVFVIGGYNERDLAKVEYCQLPATLSQDITTTDNSPEFWREAAPLNIARCGLGVCVMGDRIIAAGGVASDAVEVFQPPNAQSQHGQWTLISRMNQERYKFSLAAGQGYLFAF
ncbi:unnamed protein product, partial [Dibothriocephalus latus]